MSDVSFGQYVDTHVQKCADRLGVRIPVVGAVDAAVCLALNGMAESALASLDEESLTAGFVARLSSQLPWCFSAYPNNTPQAVPQWGQYKKNARDKDGESWSGADFCLAIPFGGDSVRLALFQAKTWGVYDGSRYADLKRKASGKENTVQIQKLRDMPQKLGAGNSSWIHYVLWPTQGGTAQCICIDEIGYDGASDSESVILDSDKGLKSFAEVLVRGSAPGLVSLQAPGWWETRLDETLIGKLPALLEIANLVFIDSSGAGGDMLQKHLGSQEGVEGFSIPVEYVAPANAAHSDIQHQTSSNTPTM